MTKPRSVTSKEVLRNWKSVTDAALREPILITSHGRVRHALLSYGEYERLLNAAQTHSSAHVEEI